MTEESKRSAPKLHIKFCDRIIGNLRNGQVFCYYIFLSFLSKFPGVVLMGLMFNFIRNCKAIFQCSYIKHSTKNIREFQVLHILTNTQYCQILLFFNSFIEAKWTYNKLQIFKSYNLICFDIGIQL